jgi:hypothetical protein
MVAGKRMHTGAANMVTGTFHVEERQSYAVTSYMPYIWSPEPLTRHCAADRAGEI